MYQHELKPHKKSAASSSTGNAVSKVRATFEDNRPQAVAQRKTVDSMQSPDNVAQAVNNTGLPNNLKAGIENLSGYSMDDVKVHYNSSKPSQLQAHAYAQGTNIHLASGQEKHLPHEAWHVVQQKQGRVKPTMQFNGAQINDSASLEHEATAMGNKAVQTKSKSNLQRPKLSTVSNNVHQRVVDLSSAALAHTAGNLYYAARVGGINLYSTAGAPAPEPRALFSEHADVSQTGAPVDVWRSRSKLADKHKLAGTTPVLDSGGAVITETFARIDAVLAEIKRLGEIDANAGPAHGGPQIATAGPNDCVGYATTLQSLIAELAPHAGGLIGTKYVHETVDGSGAQFRHHGATVVAQDGGDVVTLEAHAGQNIAQPLFHIRAGGITGFEAANHAASPHYKPTAIAYPVHTVELDVARLQTAWKNPGAIAYESAVYRQGDESIDAAVAPPVAHAPAVAHPAPAAGGGRNWGLIGAALVALIAVAGTVIYQATRKN